MRYTFFNSGTAYSFDPKRKANDGRTGELRSLLDIHKDEVKFRATPECFIVTDTGEILGEGIPFHTKTEKPARKRK